LNWVMLDDSRRPVPLPEEALSLSIPGADVTLNLHSAIAGGTTHILRQLGTMYITNQRLLFVAEKAQTPFDTLSIPPLTITSTSFVQPWFSANYLQITLGRPVDGGGITAGSTVEIRLNDTGLFQLVGLVEQMHAQAIQRMRTETEYNTLPMYIPTTAPQGGASPEPATNPPNELPPAYEV